MGISKDKISVIIKDFLKEKGINSQDDSNLNDSINIQNLGLDSIEIIELILNIEKFYGIKFNSYELKMENFTNIDSIYKLLRKIL